MKSPPKNSSSPTKNLRAELWAISCAGLIEAHAKDWTPRTKRKPSVWATEERIIAAGTSPLSNGGNMRYSHAIMPHCVEPMDAADEPGVRKIVLWMPIRDGKTLSICANIIGRTVTDDPANIYSVHPTDDNASIFSTGDIEPMIDACLSGYFVEKKSRDTGRTIELKKFIGGWLRIFSANALNKFAGTSVGVLLLHELDRLNPEAIWKAFGRTTGFKDAIIVMESTGTLAAEIEPVTGKKVYRSNIEEAYDLGDKRKWFCPCQRCGYLQSLKYEQIKYPAGKMELAFYECEACAFEHDAKAWRRMAAAGKWYPTAGLIEAQEKEIAENWHHARAIDPTVRSYWRNGFNSLLPHSKGYRTKLHQFVAEGEAAQRSPVSKMVWTQEVKAELWNPEEEGEPSPPWKPIFDRREDYGLIVPQGGLLLTGFVDCQLDRLEVQWTAFGRKEQSWNMDHVVLNGHVRDAEVWKALQYELTRKWKRIDGAEMALSMAFIDGGHYAEDVYRFFQNLARDPMPGLNGHVRASKGVGQHGHPIITRKMMSIAKNLKGHHIGTWEAKDRIYERLKMDPIENDEREGLMHFNKRFSEEYCQQAVVERATVTFERGLEIRKYINPKQERNEALDLLVGCLAAFRLHPHNLDAIEAELLAKKEEANRPPVNNRQIEYSESGFEISGSRWRI